jgi:hypothetical protein
MKVKLIDAAGQHVTTFCAGAREFERWMADVADEFFNSGGCAEVLNDRDVRFFTNAAQSRAQLRANIRTAAI